MANRLLADSLNWCAPFLRYTPLTAGGNSEPTISSANIVLQMSVNPPFTWPWNRNEVALTAALTAGTQDYAQAIADFGFLEKVSLTFGGATKEVKDVFNSAALGITTEQARPHAVAVKTNDGAGNIGFRFLNAPDKAYAATLTYQKKVVAFVATGLTVTNGVYSGGPSWPIPDEYLDIYNPLLLSFLMDAFEDDRAPVYRARGIAALLARAEGLTEMQKNIFLTQWLRNDNQALAAQLKTTQGQQARAQ